ncbi:MAG: hypothetical protein Q8R09_03615, partial [Anaerolineaceae bacterium]|nr:hypothetical protein [Anaerolineaceae bacterium]
FDKEFIRRHYAALGYRGEGEPPVVDASLWVQASQRYIQIYELLTGLTFDPAEYPVNPRLISNLKQSGVLS